MLTIILTRHGQTNLNLNGVYRGRIDVELNETGLNQAEQLANYLIDKGITRIFSSPLKRSLRTAEIVASKINVAVQESPELIDFDHGEWQGLSYAAVQDKYRDIYAQWIENPKLARIPGGESLDDVLKRIASLINSVIKSDIDNVLLVSHRAVNRVILCHLLGLDTSHYWNFDINSCALTTFTYNAHGQHRLVLLRHNEDHFLPSPLQEKG